MKDNRGSSLIEVIIVLAITAVLTGGVAISLNLLKLADVHQCATVIDDSLSKLKLDAMSKADRYHYLVLEWDATDDCYYLHGASSTTPLNETNWTTATTLIPIKKLAGSSITIAYTDRGDGTNLQDIDDTNPAMLVSVKPDSGAYRSPWKQIVITGRAEKLTIHMVTATGKHFIK